jgi:hypothetical protein
MPPFALSRLFCNKNTKQLRFLYTMTILRLKQNVEREGKHRNNNNNNNNSIQNRQGGFAYMYVMWVDDLTELVES